MAGNATNPLPSLILASARDAADRRMRAAGRTKWTVGDYNAAAVEQDRLIDAAYGEGPEGRVRFGFAAMMEKQGLLTVSMKNFRRVFEGAWEDYHATINRDAA